MNMAQRLDVKSIKRQLCRGAWFAELPGDLQDALVDGGIVRQFDKDEHIVEQGHDPEGIYAVLEGKVAFLNLLPDDREFLLDVVGPSYWFADPSVLLEKPMPHRVVARSRVRVLLVPVAVTSRIRNRSALWANCFSRMHATRFLHVVDALAESAAMPHTSFLRQRLVDLARNLEPPDGTRSPGADEIIDIAVSQEELALMVGVSRQSLNGYLSELQGQGLLEAGFRSIRIRRSMLDQLAPTEVSPKSRAKKKGAGQA